MRTDEPAGQRGYFHEAALYGSDEEFLAIVLPFVQDGVAADEPTLIGVGVPMAALLREAVQEVSGLVFLEDGSGERTRPASLLEANRRMIADLVAAGARRIRMVGAVPHPGLGASWDKWARYEATVNHAYAPLPVWGLCPYDTRSTPDYVVADVLATHPYLATVDGHLVNPRCQDPAEFLAARAPGGPDPLEAAADPLVDLVGPTAAAARDAVRGAGLACELPLDQIEDLVFAVSEAVTNALLHGRPPVRFRVWRGRRRVVATVSDTGTGPTDPFAGLLPATGRNSGGLGLWSIHQMFGDVMLHRSGQGFTFRLVAGPDGEGDRYG